MSMSAEPSSGHRGVLPGKFELHAGQVFTPLHCHQSRVTSQVLFHTEKFSMKYFSLTPLRKVVDIGSQTRP
jgi:hypothetical protein